MHWEHGVGVGLRYLLVFMASDHYRNTGVLTGLLQKCIFKDNCLEQTSD